MEEPRRRKDLETLLPSARRRARGIASGSEENEQQPLFTSLIEDEFLAEDLAVTGTPGQRTSKGIEDSPLRRETRSETRTRNV